MSKQHDLFVSVKCIEEPHPFLIFRFQIGGYKRGVSRFLRIESPTEHAAEILASALNDMLALIHPFVDMEALQQHITTELKKQQPEPKETPR